MSNIESNFDKFWQASELDKFNIREFAQQLETYDSNDKELLLEFPDNPTPLPHARTKLNSIAKNRKSDRAFSDDSLSIKDLGIILSSFYAWNGLEHRAFPSAGATYTTEIFVVTFKVRGFSNKIVYYDPEKHGTIVIDSHGPDWDEAKSTLNMSIDGTPATLIIYTCIPNRATAKYGERGGRFALLEAGAAMQQLSLQIANTHKLKGVIVGGMLDKYWLKKLQIDKTGAIITLGYLVGN